MEVAENPSESLQKGKTMPGPTDTLKHEHKIILLVLDLAEKEADRILSTGEVRADRIEKMTEFFREFADRCHHAKEEKLLFQKMNERGMPVEGGPLAVMLHEHDQGRGLVRGVIEALPGARRGDQEAKSTVAENLTSFVAMLRAHIGKEDNILYAMADNILTAEDQRELSEGFERVESEEIGRGVHEKYHRIAEELAGE
jgi:hemerythrin-like domain-containing protein